MNNLLIVPAFLDSYRSLKDKSLKLVFETNEPTPEQFLQIASNIQYPGYLAFNKDVFAKEQISAIESLKIDYEDGSKTKSQRLKAVLYRNFEKDNKGYKIFDDYYNYQMEQLINHFKSKLE